MISTNIHNITVGQVDTFTRRLRQEDFVPELLSGEHKLIFTHRDGLLVYGWDDLPDYVREELDRGMFEITKPLSYWCGVGDIKEAVKDILFERWYGQVHRARPLYLERIKESGLWLAKVF